MLLRGLGDVCARYPAATPVAGRSKVDPSPMPSPWPLLSPGQRLVLALQPSLPSAWCTSMREESVCSRAIYYYLLTFLSWIATYYLANLATALEPLKTLGELQPRSPWQRLDQLGFSWQDCYTRRIPASARTDCGRRSPLTGRSRDTAPAVSRPSQPPPRCHRGRRSYSSGRAIHRLCERTRIGCDLRDASAAPRQPRSRLRCAPL